MIERAPHAPHPAGPPADHSFASSTLATHLARGVAGFGPLLLAWYLWPRVGLPALVPAALGIVALRGCPMCWTIGLLQTISRGRASRACADGTCVLVRATGPARRDRPVP